MLVTNTWFTKDAIETANNLYNKPFLKLRDFDDLRNWIVNDFSGEAREIPGEIKVAPDVVVKVTKPDFSSLFHTK